jgi:hypothetical protein
MGDKTMRIAVSILALLVGGGVAQAQQVEILSARPRHIEIAASCWSSSCQLGASDIAQGICHGAFQDGPRRALYVRSEVVDRGFFQERVVFVFRCDRRSIICQAGSCN